MSKPFNIINTNKDATNSAGVILPEKAHWGIRNNEGSITYAEYLFDNDIIYLNESAVTSDKQFVMTILHEIDHAIEADERGADQFEEEYFAETAVTGYYNNRYEIQAENFAEQNYNFWLNKLNTL